MTLGTKRLCAGCGAKFYDLQQSPITCPKCSAVFEPIEVNKRFRTGAASEPKSDVAPAVAETAEVEFISLEDAEAEAEVEDEGELADESVDDGALIEESEQEDADVTGILGEDVEIEDEKTDE